MAVRQEAAVYELCIGETILNDKASAEQFQRQLRDLCAVVEVQQRQLATYQNALSVLGETLIELNADTKITKIVASTLLREVAGTDREKLDRLIATSLARAEHKAGEFSPPARSAILRSIDEIIFLAEDR